MVEIKNITKTYRTRRGDVQALRDVNLRIEKGEFVVLCGPSGSGKTTLLMTVAAMLRPTAGSVCVEQKDLYAMSIRDRAEFRARNIGFVFQMFHLVPYLNIVENVLLARHSPGGSPGRLGPLAHNALRFEIQLCLQWRGCACIIVVNRQKFFWVVGRCWIFCCIRSQSR